MKPKHKTNKVVTLDQNDVDSFINQFNLEQNPINAKKLARAIFHEQYLFLQQQNFQEHVEKEIKKLTTSFEFMSSEIFIKQLKKLQLILTAPMLDIEQTVMNNKSDLQSYYLSQINDLQQALPCGEQLSGIKKVFTVCKLWFRTHFSTLTADERKLQISLKGYKDKIYTPEQVNKTRHLINFLKIQLLGLSKPQTYFISAAMEKLNTMDNNDKQCPREKTIAYHLASQPETALTKRKQLTHFKSCNDEVKNNELFLARKQSLGCRKM